MSSSSSASHCWRSLCSRHGPRRRKATRLRARWHTTYSLPKPDNAIYHVVDALAVLQRSPFPFEINAVTREYFTQMAGIEAGPTAADLRAILTPTPDPAAALRLAADARYNSLEKLFDDPRLAVKYRSDAGDRQEHGSDRKAMAPPPLLDDVMQSLRSVSAVLWPDITVIPMMMTGASDSVYTMMAGMPSYGICGVAIDRADVRMHCRDERVPVESFYKGVEFYYEFLKKLTTQH